MKIFRLFLILLLLAACKSKENVVTDTTVVEHSVLNTEIYNDSTNIFGLFNLTEWELDSLELIVEPCLLDSAAKPKITLRAKKAAGRTQHTQLDSSSTSNVKKTLSDVDKSSKVKKKEQNEKITVSKPGNTNIIYVAFAICIISLIFIYNKKNNG